MKARIANRSVQKNRSPHWRALTVNSIRRVPRAVRSWITTTSSMTRRIAALVSQPVVVSVLRDARGRLHADEQRLLGAKQSTGHVREIILSAGGRKLLLARTVFIARRLKQNRDLKGLGTRPLGELLFSKGRATWRVREFGRISSRHPVAALLESATTSQQKNEWVRRTVFLLSATPILVTEAFLPDLFQVQQHSRERNHER
jgi:chorismate--pyruvate lyase